jgi:hypothetical protein
MWLSPHDFIGYRRVSSCYPDGRHTTGRDLCMWLSPHDFIGYRRVSPCYPDGRHTTGRDLCGAFAVQSVVDYT